MPHPPGDDSLRHDLRAIGDRLRVARLRRNRTQESVFLAAGVARSTYQEIEAGTTDARIGTLIRIARALGVHVADLLRDR
ncbi:helix-turn-helix transcriptional regulator [Streptomyces sp. NPDC048256]|uniref:helix-turn-helix domain-containing protein n=1 Tax=unclassified Streptomyces TaxID=2593676 RepID=UPI0033FF6D5A